ncbi:response regulator [Nafulsella turpanensis]|uniref:response regulator n=1 Tax=Nafulsella turpanensis TaxID=1265690 RepID=UPI000344D3B7|nr:response regulator [Nafulsella turpanensis]
MGKIGKILLVDDDEITCFINRNMLENMEVATQIEAVHDGRQALQYVKGKFIGTTNPNYDTDLLFLDLNMPVMNGFEFLEELSKWGDIDRNRLKIIILTSSANKKDAEEVAQYNELVSGYITKPLQAEKLRKFMYA